MIEEVLHSWGPEPVTMRDEIPATPAERLSALLDVAGPSRSLPPLWHWLYFLDWPAQRQLGVDGHPSEGHFLPPLPNRRRMFAGGRAEHHTALDFNTTATRVSSLQGVATKRGSTGDLVFVTVRHEVSQSSRLCLVEETDVVYRFGDDRPPLATYAIDTETMPSFDASWQLSIRPDPTLLFRFSALTANAHRIHYDAPYTEHVEGYPGLVVHGPLLALLMLELVRANVSDRQVRSVSFRLRRPVFVGEHVVALGDPDGAGQVHLRVGTARDPRHATAEVVFDRP